MIEIKDNELYWAKVRPDAIIPTKNKEDAGYDIYPCFDEKFIHIKPQETVLISTGIACAVSDKYYLQVQERGSTGVKGIKYSAGVIDSGFRGEIKIAITNANSAPIIIYKDEKLVKSFYDSNYILYPYEKAIAQLIVHEIPKMNCKEISYEDLKQTPSVRGEGMLGSSGK